MSVDFHLKPMVKVTKLTNLSSLSTFPPEIPNTGLALSLKYTTYGSYHIEGLPHTEDTTNMRYRTSSNVHIDFTTFLVQSLPVSFVDSP